MSFSRWDLKNLGFDGQKVNDGMMQMIADEIGEECIEQIFSLYLPAAAEEFHIRKKGRRENAIPIKAKLRLAHVEEIVRKNAEDWNCSEAGPALFRSKTNKGIVVSRMSPKSGDISHEWIP